MPLRRLPRKAASSEAAFLIVPFIGPGSGDFSEGFVCISVRAFGSKISDYTPEESRNLIHIGQRGRRAWRAPGAEVAADSRIPSMASDARVCQ